MRLLFMIPIASAVLACSARAEEDHAGLGAHQHGRGTLDIAVENDRVAMELTAPGMDIVGFEHAARTAEHEAAIGEAQAVLRDPVSLFGIPEEASCRVEAIEFVHDEEEGEHGEAGHAEFHVSYSLVCDSIGRWDVMTLAYFDAFPAAGELVVSVIGGGTASRHVADRGSPRIDLSGHF